MKSKVIIFAFGIFISFFSKGQIIDSLQKIKAGFQAKIINYTDSIQRIEKKIEEVILVQSYKTNDNFIIRTTFKEGCPIKLVPEFNGRNIRFSKNNDSVVLVSYAYSKEDILYFKLSDSGYARAIYISETDELAGLLRKLKIEKDLLNAAIEKDLLNAAKKKVEVMPNPRDQKLIEIFGTTIAKRIINKQIWIGMTANMAVQSRGYPLKVNRTVGSFGVHEQWVYNSGTYLYFENDILKSWQD